MKLFFTYLKKAVVCTIVLGALCTILYPAALTLAGQVLFPAQANGSLIKAVVGGKERMVGSKYVGQQFEEPWFFHGRISSVGYNCYTTEEKEDKSYGGVASGSFNYGNSNPDLKTRVEADLESFMKSNPGVRREDIPADLLTASGSGLDPHITVQGAKVQVEAVSKASGLSQEELYQIIEDNTEEKVLGIFGEEKVNVLGCNLEIAGRMGK